MTDYPSAKVFSSLDQIFVKLKVVVNRINAFGSNIVEDIVQ